MIKTLCDSCKTPCENPDQYWHTVEDCAAKALAHLHAEINQAKLALGGFVKPPFDGTLQTAITAISMRCGSAELEVQRLKELCVNLAETASTLSGADKEDCELIEQGKKEKPDHLTMPRPNDPDWKVPGGEVCCHGTDIDAAEESCNNCPYTNCKWYDPKSNEHCGAPNIEDMKNERCFIFEEK